MDMGELARSLRARMPWSVGQKVLRENELRRGNGWENTVARLSDPEFDFSDKIDAIATALREHILCGEKLVRFYEVDSLNFRNSRRSWSAMCRAISFPMLRAWWRRLASLSVSTLAGSGHYAGVISARAHSLRTRLPLAAVGLCDPAELQVRAGHRVYAKGPSIPVPATRR